MRLSILWRLTLWGTLALALVLACFAALVYGMFREALYGQTDRLLRAGLGQLRDDPRIHTSTERRLHYWVEEFRDHQGLLCVIYRADGSLRAATPGMGEESLPPPTLPGVSSRELPAVGRQRVMAEQMRLGGEELTVLLLAPLEAVDRELERLGMVLLAACPLALLLAGGLGHALARKALAPVERIRRTADAISADRLDERIPVENPGDELGRLAQTINAMVGRLERSFTEVHRFTADASHELRTPLTALRSEVEIALGKQLTVAEHRQLLESVLEELVRLSRLTDQLLTLSRCDAGVAQLESTPVHLGPLAAGVVDALQPLADVKKVRLRLDEVDPVQVPGDEVRLRQILINLVDNALKHTPEGGSVTVRVSRGEGRGVVEVEDTGCGIPPEHLERVFDRFYRVERARSRAEGGTGLGLSIARSIVSAHGGRIEMRSRPGQGTTCVVSLPDSPQTPTNRS